MRFGKAVFGASIALLFSIAGPAAAGDVLSSLAGHWRLDEAAAGPVVNEVGPDGTLLDATMAIGQPGRVGTAYSFDGANDKVDTNLNDVVPANGPFSIFSWVKTSEPASGTGQYLFSNYDFGLLGRSALQILNGAPSWFTNSNVRTAGTTVNDGAWHHVGVTRDAGDSYSLWIDGVAEPVGSDPTGISTGSRNWLMGGWHPNDDRNYTGSLDDVRVYHRAFAADDVHGLPGSPGMLAHWEFDEISPGTLVDSTGNSSGGSIGSGVTVNQPGRVGTAFSFDGTSSSFVDTNNKTAVPSTGDFSYFAWIKVASGAMKAISSAPTTAPTRTGPIRGCAATASSVGRTTAAWER